MKCVKLKRLWVHNLLAFQVVFLLTPGTTLSTSDSFSSGSNNITQDQLKKREPTDTTGIYALRDKMKPCEPEEHFRCDNGECLPKSEFCDGLRHCTDGSDERPDCTDMKCPGQFECDSGECINLNLQCNNMDDCLDSSDEYKCIRPEECSAEDGQFLCKSGVECISGRQVCDKKPDCTDKSDEFPLCEKSCLNKTGECSQGCIPHPDVTKPESCYCYEGFHFQNGSSRKCEDIDECQEYGICSQICANSIGSYQCSCQEGFKISQNNRSSCELIEKNAKVIERSWFGVGVGSLTSQNGSYSMIENEVSRILAVTYNAHQGFVYWTHMSQRQGAIWRTSINGLDKKAIISGGLLYVVGISIDWITNNIYLSDTWITRTSPTYADSFSPRYRIIVCSSNGEMCSVLIEYKSHEMYPTNLEVNPNLGLMFWIDKYERIIRADMDGSNVIDICKKDPNYHIIALSVDTGNNRIYWMHRKGIDNSKLDGTDRRVVKSGGMGHSMGGVDVLGDRVYWTTSTSGLKSCNKFDGSKEKTVLNFTLEGVIGIAIFHVANQPINRYNQCSIAECSHICVLRPGNSFKCLCPVGMRLQTSGKTCEDDPTSPKLLIGYKDGLKMFPINSFGTNFISEIFNPEVKDIRALSYNPISHGIIFSSGTSADIYWHDLSSGNTSVLVNDSSTTGSEYGGINGIAIDPIGDNLYWIDSNRSRIEVMSLGTKSRLSLLERTNYHLIDIVIVAEKGTMFVAEENPNSQFTWQILQMDMDGSSQKIIYKCISSTGSAQGIIHRKESARYSSKPDAVAYNRMNTRLYWTIGENNVIESIQTEGKMDFQRLLISKSAPFGIASYKNQIYWTDHLSPQLHSQSLRIYNEYPDDESTCWRYYYSSYIPEKNAVLVPVYEPICFGNCSISKQSHELFNSRIVIIERDDKEIENLRLNHPCSSKSEKKPCSHICLISKNQHQFTCHCPQGLILNDDNATCSPLSVKPALGPVTTNASKISTENLNNSRESSKMNGADGFLNADGKGEDSTTSGPKLKLIFQAVAIIIIVGIILLVIVWTGIYLERKSRNYRRFSVRPFFRN